MEPSLLKLFMTYPVLSQAAFTDSWVKDSSGDQLHLDSVGWVSDVLALSGTVYTGQNLRNLYLRGSTLNSRLDTYLRHSG